MLVKKSLSVLVMLGILFNTANLSSLEAATFEDINQSSVFITQNTNYTCTLAAATILLRRTAMMRGDSDWDTITESTVRSTAWLEDAGLLNSFEYKGIVIKNQKFNSGRAGLIRLLEEHPEGIVIYRSGIHAMVLTDYTDGIFYLADTGGFGPAYTRFPETQMAQNANSGLTIDNVDQIWYVESPDVNLDSSFNNYTKTDLGNEFYASVYNSSLEVALSADGNNAYGGKVNDGDEQLWKFVKQSDGSYSITNKKSELSLDVSNYGTTGGTNIQLCEFSGNTAQQFFIYNAIDGYLIKPKCSGLVFDLETFNDCNLATYPLDDNLDNKKFLIKKYYDDNKLADFGDEFDANIYNPKLNLYLTANDFNVSGEEKSNQENQIWHFTKNSDGGYFVKSRSSSLNMDVLNFGSDNGTNIQLVVPVNNLAQLFYIYESHEGFLFRPACSGLVFDLENFNSYNLATYELDDYYDNKEFRIIKLTDEDFVLGDCNSDGTISTADIVTLKKWLLNIENTKIDVDAADFNQNGSVDVIDYIMLKNIFLS